MVENSIKVEIKLEHAFNKLLDSMIENNGAISAARLLFLGKTVKSKTDPDVKPFQVKAVSQLIRLEDVDGTFLPIEDAELTGEVQS